MNLKACLSQCTLLTVSTSTPHTLGRNPSFALSDKGATGGRAGLGVGCSGVRGGDCAADKWPILKQSILFSALHSYAM